MQSEPTPEKSFETTARVLEDLFRYDLSPAEAVDYLAVEKAGRSTKEWAAIRDKTHGTVSGNVSGANEKIYAPGLDPEISETDDTITVHVSDKEGDRHELPFSRQTTVMGHEGTVSLELIYVTMGAVHGYYVGEDGEEFEGTLWFDGWFENSFQEFNFFDTWDSAEEKADTILWQPEDEHPE